MSTQPDVPHMLQQMVSHLQSLLKERNIADPLMIGIHTGGVWIAEFLHQALAIQDPLGSLNITFYRDDFSRMGMHPQVQPSQLPFAIEDRHIILVDDVLHTGRTIRAALNEIFDYGRPASVILAALIERNGKELPICADVVGQVLNLNLEQHVKLTGPEPLATVILGDA